jgi:hypothetical protein
MLVDGQMGQESFNFGTAHLLGVALVMEEDKAFDPGNIAFFCAQGAVFEPEGVANPIKQFFSRFLEIHQHISLTW